MENMNSLLLLTSFLSAVAELADLIESHDHLNPIFIPKCDGSWRVNYGEVVLELKTSCIPSRFVERIFLSWMEDGLDDLEDSISTDQLYEG
ncbi:hypothetical protein Tco_1564855 [Tanacetum coccineum]